MMDETIHWADWASQPTVRIACTQESHFPWNVREDLPRMVHEIPVENSDSILYSFNPQPINCIACREVESFKHILHLDGLYERTWKASGLTEEEYNARENAKLDSMK